MDFLSVSPKGWLRDYLSTQMEGLTGHMTKAGYPFTVAEWGQPDFQNSNGDPVWWPYETTAYWTDGFVRCAILLEDQDRIKEAERIIYNVINNADEDGYLGPKILKPFPPEEIYHNPKRNCYRWAHVSFFRAVMALYEYNHDQKLLDALTKYYLNTDFSFKQSRNVQNVEIMCWLYKKTGDTRLRDLAEKTYLDYDAYSTVENFVKVMEAPDEPVGHGVSYNEFVKLGALLYSCTGNQKYLWHSRNGLDRLLRYTVLPDGCPSGQEGMAGNDPMNAHETCLVSDYTWSLEQIFSATNDSKYGDLIERCIFNATPGCVLENFRGLQYFSCANQILCDKQSTHIPNPRQGTLMSYRPNPGTECCPGNVNRAMPNFVMNMWVKEGGNYKAFLLGPSEIRDNGMTIREITNYPFEDSFRFEVETDRPFVLYVRYPGWYTDCRVCMDSAEVSCTFEGGYISIPIAGDCVVDVEFDAQVEKVNAKRGVFFQRGPLLYSLGQKGRREVDTEDARSTEDFPALNIYPVDKWNYGIPADAVYEYVSVPGANKFDLDCDLPYIVVDAIEITNLQLRHTVVRQEDLVEKQLAKYKPGNYILTPDIMDAKDAVCGERTKVRLYPYGACKLRMTVFTEIPQA